MDSNRSATAAQCFASSNFNLVVILNKIELFTIYYSAESGCDCTAESTREYAVICQSFVTCEVKYGVKMTSLLCVKIKNACFCCVNSLFHIVYHVCLILSIPSITAMGVSPCE